MGGSDKQADWRFVKDAHQFRNLFGKGTDVRSVTANNPAEPKMRQDQQGGTGMAAFGRISTFVKESPKDPSNLGRFCSMLLTGGGKKTHLVQLYVPSNPEKKLKGFTVWDQQSRVWEKKGNLRSPRTILVEVYSKILSFCCNVVSNLCVDVLMFVY